MHDELRMQVADALRGFAKLVMRGSMNLYDITLTHQSHSIDRRDKVVCFDERVQCTVGGILRHHVGEWAG
jgi:hypothetical protein